MSASTLLAKATTRLTAAAVKRMLIESLSRLNSDSLAVEFENGERRIFGPRGHSPVTTLRVHSPEFYLRVLKSGELGVGESFMEGLWNADDLTAFLALCIENRDLAPGALKKLNDASRVTSRRLHLKRRNTESGARNNVHAHYDLGNDFFRLFLDETMTYSCAYFETPDQDLADAQLAKYRRLAQKACLTRTDDVLEIGSGWGGFAIYAAETYGCNVTTITISREQLELARARVAEAGLARQIAVEYVDYRDVAGRFDKIVSIEMFEAVGSEYFATFFEKCDAVLNPGGRLVLQTISVPDRTFTGLRDGVNWMQKYIFPGGMLPSISELEKAARGTSLILSAVEDIGLHYVRTLQHWRQRFSANLDGVRALGFDDRFIRMWHYYLCSSEAGFKARTTGDLQVVFDKV